MLKTAVITNFFLIQIWLSNLTIPSVIRSPPNSQTLNESNVFAIPYPLLYQHQVQILVNGICRKCILIKFIICGNFITHYESICILRLYVSQWVFVEDMYTHYQISCHLNAVPCFLVSCRFNYFRLICHVNNFQTTVKS